MTSMFWGLRLEPGKRYSTTVDKSFHVSMAALDCSSVKADNEILSVMIDEGESNLPFILCNLQKTKLLQSPLDLNFMTGDSITFFCKGNGVVHLSGYIVPDDDDELTQLGEEEDDDEDAEEEDEGSEEELEVDLIKGQGKGKVNGLQGKRKVDELKNPATKRKKIEEDSDDSNDDEDDLASDDIEDESMGIEGEEESDEDEDDDDDDEDDEDDSDEESDEENKVPSKGSPQQQQKKNKKNTQVDQNKQNANKQQNQAKQKLANKLQVLNTNTQGKKDKKKNSDKTAGISQKNAAKLNNSGNEGGTSPVKKGIVEGSKKEGGVIVKDIKLGNGQVCKSGKMACVYYTGRFKQNNKVFDSTTEGSGFKFRVGKGEVIKGWDVGVVGMKVGGKRLITCPAPMAYGQKGSPPTIPPNSTLVFEVELKNIN